MSPKRSQTGRHARTFVALVLALGLIVAVPRGRAPYIDAAPLGATTVTTTPSTGPAPGMYTSNGTLFVPGAQPVRLAATPSAPLSGWLSPVMVPAPDGRTLVYSAWRQALSDDPTDSWTAQGIQPGDILGTPDLRRVDLVNGTDTLLESGAIAPMFSGDGTLAYVRGTTPGFIAGSNYTGTIMVRSFVDDAPVAWSDSTKRYAIAAWADSTLLAYEIGEGETLSLVAFDGPGRFRSLGTGTLVAVSPDGSLVLTEQTDSAPSQVSLVRVSDGAVLSTLRLDQGVAGTYGIGALSYAGAWKGSTIVARADMGLVLFKVSGTLVGVADLLRFDPASYPTGVIQPRLANADGTEVTAWGDQLDATGATHAVELDCQLAAHACTSFLMIDPTAQPAYNPSAPFSS